MESQKILQSQIKLQKDKNDKKENTTNNDNEKCQEYVDSMNSCPDLFMVLESI